MLGPLLKMATLKESPQLQAKIRCQISTDDNIDCKVGHYLVPPERVNKILQLFGNQVVPEFSISIRDVTRSVLAAKSPYYAP